jgi:hypothetical protein
MTPLACNIGAFTAAERDRYQTLTRSMISKTAERRELPDGYSFRIDLSKASIVDAAEWICYERRCCPFFRFQLEILAGDGGVWLSLAGDAGVKEFIIREFGLLNGPDVSLH